MVVRPLEIIIGNLKARVNKSGWDKSTSLHENRFRVVIFYFVNLLNVFITPADAAP